MVDPVGTIPDSSGSEVNSGFFALEPRRPHNARREAGPFPFFQDLSCGAGSSRGLEGSFDVLVEIDARCSRERLDDVGHDYLAAGVLVARILQELLRIGFHPRLMGTLLPL